VTRRRWIADTWSNTSAALTGDQALHLARVLRAQPGMEFDILAGGMLWLATITEVTEQEVRFALIRELETDPALPVTLLLSIFKFDRMEWAIEKATELGVARIIPIIARRTEKHLAQAAEKRVERWRRIAREAAQQSRRSDIPEITAALPLKAALQLSSQPPVVDAAVTRLVLSEQEQTLTLKSAVENSLAATTAAAAVVSDRYLHLSLGPEGGWAPEELALFAAGGWTPVTLGPRILRVETAAIAALAVVAALLTQSSEEQDHHEPSS
jgi:16S rRNA (uracil1498-N3)-methyltransferase